MNTVRVIGAALALLLAFGCGDDGGDVGDGDGGTPDAATATCSDGIQNQDESDTDCGGVCGATCEPGDTCGADGDCTTDDCDGTCQPLASCEDGVANGMETDVDCGGPMCMGCAEGDMCTEDDDCAAGVCGSGGTCVPSFTIGGTVTGVDGAGMVLQNDGGDDLSITEDGVFAFATAVGSGDDYDVTVLSGPGEQDCTVSFGRGTVSADVTDVAVDCVTTPDDIADAFGLTEGVEVRWSSVDSTLEDGEDVCDEGGTMWFTFTAPTAGNYTTYGTGSDHDTEIAWSESLAGPLGDCNDDANDSYDAVDALLPLAADDQRYVQVGLNSSDARGTGGIGVVEVVDAPDAFADAVALTLRAGAPTAVAGIAFTGDEGVETDEADACGGETLAAESAWLTFTPPTSGSWMLESKSNDSTDIALYSGSAVDDLTLVHCATTDHLAFVADLSAGETYRIRVGNADGDAIHSVIRAERVLAPLSASLVDADGDGSSTNLGEFSDLAIVDGEPAIAYYDGTNGELRYAARSGGTWTDVLVDADGDGTSTDVGLWVSLAVLDSGEPAVAYYDRINRELRYAERSGGSWTDVLVDADGEGTSTEVGLDPSLIVLSSGNPAISYRDVTAGELRYAERESGTWSDVLVDADGDGTSTDVGRDTSLIELPAGPAISYVDQDASALRFARRESGSWSDELAFEDAEGDQLRAANVVLDSEGNPVLSATDTNQANHVIAWWNGSSWDIDWDYADRNLAELDFECSTPRMLIDESDRLMLFWTDCNYSGAMAISIRDTDGAWAVRPVASQHVAPADASFEGSVAVWNAQSFGVAWLPSGEMIVSFQDNYLESLWVAEGS
jgi:hypothetical protein